MENIINNIINSYKQVNDQIIIIENKFDDEIIEPMITLKNSLIIENCENITILIKQKINHLLVRNCHNIKLLISGCITGFDLLYSNNNIICNINDISHIIDYYKSSNNIYHLYRSINDAIIFRVEYSHSNNIKLYNNNILIADYTHSLNLFNPNYRLYITRSINSF